MTTTITVSAGATDDEVIDQLTAGILAIIQKDLERFAEAMSAEGYTDDEILTCIREHLAAHPPIEARP